MYVHGQVYGQDRIVEIYYIYFLDTSDATSSISFFDGATVTVANIATV